MSDKGHEIEERTTMDQYIGDPAVIARLKTKEKKRKKKALEKKRSSIEGKAIVVGQYQIALAMMANWLAKKGVNAYWDKVNDLTPAPFIRPPKKRIEIPYSPPHPREMLVSLEYSQELYPALEHFPKPTWVGRRSHYDKNTTMQMRI